MLLKKIQLNNFRKFSSGLWEINDQTTIIISSNATGKTSILEAISLLSGTDSFRANKIEEMISFDQEMARVVGLVTEKTNSEPDRLEIILTRGILQGKRTQKRLFSLNLARRRRKDFAGHLLTVVFRPEDLRLIEGSPSRRRAWLNTPLSLISSEYELALRQYEQTLIRRNKLLAQIREGEQNPQILTFWNQSLIKNGQILQKNRTEFCEYCNTVLFPLHFQIEYDRSLISQARLDQYASAEIASAHTLVGPHKDDIKIIYNFASDHNQPEQWQDIAAYGSRGQQRLAVLWLKLAELQFVEATKETRPLLLLDDIMSELDDSSKKMVIKLMKNHQTIVTTTEPKVVELLQKNLEQTKIIRLEV